MTDSDVHMLEVSDNFGSKAGCIQKLWGVSVLSCGYITADLSSATRRPDSAIVGRL